MRHKSEPMHGTRSGYDWHRRDMKEDPCYECREAESAYWRNERIIRGDVIRANSHRRRAKRYKMLGLDNKSIKYTEAEILEKYGTLCHICNIEIDMNAPRQVGRLGWEMGLHMDHVYPLSRGGDDTIENIRPAHGRCNIIKCATV